MNFFTSRKKTLSALVLALASVLPVNAAYQYPDLKTGCTRKSTVYILGPQFGGQNLSSTAATKYQYAATMTYDDDLDAYYYQFTAGSNNSFELSTSTGTETVWDRYSISIHTGLYNLPANGSSYKYNSNTYNARTFDINKRYLVRHDSSLGSVAHECLDLVNGKTYTLWLHASLAHSSSTSSNQDTDYDDYLWIAEGTYAQTKHTARQELYISGSIIGRTIATNYDPIASSYYAENAGRFTYIESDGKYYYIFKPSVSTVNFTISRMALYSSDSHSQTAASNWSAVGLSSNNTNNELSTADKTAHNLYYDIWNVNGLTFGSTGGEIYAGSSATTLNHRYEGYRYIKYLDTSKYYRIVIPKDMSTIAVEEYSGIHTGMYMLGSAGANHDYQHDGLWNPVTRTGTDLYNWYKTSDFTLDSDNDIWHYTFTADGKDSFELSTKSSNIANRDLWNTGVFYPSRANYGSEVKVGYLYDNLSYGRPAEGDYAERPITGLTIGEKYTIYVEMEGGVPDKLYILPGEYNSYNRFFCYVMVDHDGGGSGTAPFNNISQVDDLGTTVTRNGMKAMMTYDLVGLKRWTYRANVNTGKATSSASSAPRFKIYDWTNSLLSAKNYLSSDPLSADNTRYHLGGAGGQQIDFDTPDHDVTIVIDGKGTYYPYFLWIEDNELDAPPVYVVDDTQSNWSTPANMTYDPAVGYYRLPIPDGSGERLRFSHYKTAAADMASSALSADEKSYGFSYDAYRASTPTVTVSTPAHAIYYDVTTSDHTTYTNDFVTLGTHFDTTILFQHQHRIDETTHQSGLIELYGSSERPRPYIIGSIIDSDYTPGTDSYTDGVHGYYEANVGQFTYDDVNDMFYYTFTYLGEGKTEFEFSRRVASEEGADDFHKWFNYNYDWARHGYKLEDRSVTSLELGQRYYLTANDDSSTTVDRMVIDDADGTNMIYGHEYTIYVDGNYSYIKVYEGAYSTNIATVQEIFMAGYAVNVDTQTLNNVQKWRFNYDPKHNFYYLHVPAGSGGGSGSTGCFQLSRTAGSRQSDWLPGVIYVTDAYENYGVNMLVEPNGTKYNVYKKNADNASYRQQKISNYNRSTGYTFYISKDLTKLWIRPDLFVIGHLTNDPVYSYTYSIGNLEHNFTEGTPRYTTPGSIRPMIWNEDLQRYEYETHGASASVFEISDGIDGSYNSWVDGMYFYTRSVGVTETEPLDAYLKGTPSASIRKYEVTRGNSSIGYMKGDMGIEAHNPDWLYTVCVSGDGSQMWVEYQPINMPLKAADFRTDATVSGNKFDVKPHYFLVGTRTSGWRLLPEWEITPVPGQDNVLNLSGRLMYDGYFAIAKVDDYNDYVHHRYQVFANKYIYNLATGQNDQDIVEDNIDQLIPLKDCGASSALLYNADDPVHDYTNSMTWDFGSNREALEEGKLLTPAMMRYALPSILDYFIVTLDDDKNPDGLYFRANTDMDDVLRARTFSIVGSDINYEQPFEFENPLIQKWFNSTGGPIDLRTLGTLYGKTYDRDNGQRIYEKNFANSWISYDNNGEPYFDAYKNTLYLTAYDRKWLTDPKHYVHFDMLVTEKETVGGTTQSVEHWLPFTSAHITFQRADLEDTTDPYNWLYKIHPQVDGQGSNNFGSGTKTGQLVTGTQNGVTYSYYEHIVTGKKDNLDTSDNQSRNDYATDIAAAKASTGRNNDGNAVYREAATSFTGASRNGDWVCYVIKDVWLKGDFKAWSGWGGNLASREEKNYAEDHTADMPKNDMRWYFGNFGHDVEGEHYYVRGHDVMTTDAHRVVYSTRRDVDEAYFRAEGSVTNSQGEIEGNPQYYNRIILWYDNNTSHKREGEVNGVLQFIQETIGPNIKAYKKTGNTLYTMWNIVDRDDADNTRDSWPVVKYQIKRYYYVEVDGSLVPTLYRTFPAQTPTGITIADMKATSMRFDDPYQLPSGSYYYTIDVTVEDGLGRRITKSATSNVVVVSEAAEPVRVSAEQAMEGGLYTFDVKVKILPPVDPAVLELGSHVYNQSNYSILEDTGSIVLTVDPKIAQMVANGAEIIMDEASFSFDPLTDYPTYRTNVLASDGRMGFTVDAANKVGSKYVLDANNQITFNLHNNYKNSNGTINRYSHYFKDGYDFCEMVNLPTVTFRMVRPTENLAGNDRPQYSFSVRLMPHVIRAGNAPDAEPLEAYADMETIWRQGLNLQDGRTSTGVFAPAPQVTIGSAQVANIPLDQLAGDGTETYALDESCAVDGMMKPELMPAGALVKYKENSTEKIKASDPVYYDNVNVVNLGLSGLSIPLTDETLSAIDATVTLHANSGNGKNRFDARPYTVSMQRGADTGSLMYVPVTGEQKALSETADGMSKKYDVQDEVDYGISASVEYSVSSAVADIWKDNETDDASTVTTGRSDETSAVFSFAKTGFKGGAATVARNHGQTDDIFLGQYQFSGVGADNRHLVWYGRMIFGVETSGLASGAATYLGFYAPVDIDNNLHENLHHDAAEWGRMAQGGQVAHVMTANDGTHNAAHDNAHDHIGGQNPTWGTDVTSSVNLMHSDYHKYYDGDEYASCHNWAAIGAEYNYLAICVEPMYADFFEQPDKLKGETAVTVYAVYPFVTVDTPEVRLDSPSSPVPAPARAGSAKAPATPIAYKILPVTKTMSTTVDHNDGIVTGVETVAAEYGEPEYYNLQGLRVYAPRPGEIYIIRRGNVTTKELYR